MRVSEVRIDLVEDGQGDADGRLRAFVSIVMTGELGSYCVREMKVIEDLSGALFVAMPSRKLTDRCANCNGKNHLRNRYCCECGVKLPEGRCHRDHNEKPKYHADVFYPIDRGSRHKLQQVIIAEYRKAAETPKKEV